MCGILLDIRINLNKKLINKNKDKIIMESSMHYIFKKKGCDIMSHHTFNINNVLYTKYTLNCYKRQHNIHGNFFIETLRQPVTTEYITANHEKIDSSIFLQSDHYFD